MNTVSIGSAMAGLLLLGLAACGPAAEDSGRNDSAAAENGSGAAPAAAAPAPAPAEAALAPLQLEGHGLRISGAAPGTELPFNTPKAATIDALTKALGRPPTELGENEECGGGALEFAAWEGQITAWFESGRFAGWDNKGKLKTPQGIGIGSSRSEIARLRGLEVEDSTLGTEFRAGGLSGILDSKGPDAKVTDLWGGSTCVFR